MRGTSMLARRTGCLAVLGAGMGRSTTRWTGGEDLAFMVGGIGYLQKAFLRGVGLGWSGFVVSDTCTMLRNANALFGTVSHPRYTELSLSDVLLLSYSS
jgi:hypothetical protein